MKKLPASTTLRDARKAGRLGDDQLVHLNKAEVDMLESMTMGHGLTINPQTGEKEAFLPFLLSMLPTLFPSIGAGLAGATGMAALANPLMLGALGSGLGTWAETGDLGKGLMAGVGGAALGGLGGMLGGAGAGALGSAVNPAIGSAAGAVNGQTVKSLLAGNVAKGALTQAAAPAAAGGLGGLMSGMGGMLAPMMVGAPGMYLSAQAQMPGESDKDKRRKASIERAQQESFMTPRTVNTAPDGYRHGMDEEFNFFGPGGTLTPVTTTRGYAMGGPVGGPQVMPLPGGPPVMPLPDGPQRPTRGMMPTPLTGNRMSMAPGNPNVGLWGGLQLPPRQVPRPYTPPPVIGGGGGSYGGGYEGSYSPPSMPMGGGRAPGEWGRMNVMQFADGGMVMGPGDGTSDSVPAVVNGQEPAALSDGEFVVPAMAVAKLGNGSSKAGAEKLQQMVNSLLAAQ